MNSKPSTSIIVTSITTSIVAALFATVFLVKPEFFNGLVTSKQWGIEVVAIIPAIFLVVALPFKRAIRFTVLDLLFILFVLWYVLSETMIHTSYSHFVKQNFFDVSLWLVVYLFIRNIAIKNNMVWGIAIVWMMTSLLQSGLGLLQLYGFEHSHHALFNITGTFHNPGPFSGFVVCGLPLALGIVLLSRKQGVKSYTETTEEKVIQSSTENTHSHLQNSVNSVSTQCSQCNNMGESCAESANENRWISFIKEGFNLFRNQITRYSIQVLAWITLIVILLVLPPAQSRAAWTAGILGGVFVFVSFPGQLPFRDNLIRRFKNSTITIRLLISISLLLIITTSLTGLYIMKKGSADGRLLMWQVSAQIIKEKPICGHGSGAFNTLYMNHQANWFESGKGSEAQAMVAGNPESPFNELLNLWLEKGLIALLLVAAMLFALFSSGKTRQPSSAESHCINPILKSSFKGTLVTLLTFGMFSYPFSISSFILQLVVLVAILASAASTISKPTGNKTLLITVPGVIAIITGVLYFFPQRMEHYNALKTWQEADRFYTLSTYNVAAETYADAYPALQQNGLFLQMYGKALNMDKQYHNSIEILSLAKQYFSSQIIQNTLGDNHKALGNYSEAEAAYRNSTQMIPSLLLPKYLLAKLYFESGQHIKAKQTALEIINSPVRVESSATKEIMIEMNRIIKQTTTEPSQSSNPEIN